MAYYALLAFVSLLPPRKLEEEHKDCIHRFAILVPAHNEEPTIGQTIQSCFRLDYPRDKFDIWVVADNCSDRTAEIAKSLGANCLIRSDSDQRGKGFALSYGFQQLRDKHYDAYVIVDADCVMDAQALRESDLHLLGGAQVLQMADSVLNTDDNPISYALAVGNLIENRLIYVAKSRLHLPVMLRGTGMVLHRSLLEKIPWGAHSIVEDLEYSLNLIREDIQVHFLERIEVRSAFPTDKRQLSVQRERWAEGNFRVSKTHAFKLLVEGVHKRSFRLLDAGWMLLVMSRPLVILNLLLAVLACAAAWLLQPTGTTVALLQASLVLACLYFIYFGFGIVLLGVTRDRLRLLCRAPIVLIQLSWISLCGLAGRGKLQWTRTPRSH